ncbi:peptide ABC transporter substrate-binding protein [Solibacillus silvestris]|uniref:peptide ABC transporter substrate-binding protein n=1 Tax=Solibacillus silvestris TaxID=76853 RepID=UPI003F8168A5
MIQIVLPHKKHILMQSPLYNFTSQTGNEPNDVTILHRPTLGAYNPFSPAPPAGLVYFDLWSYSFALQLHKVLKEHDAIKGVIRFRRTTMECFSIEEDMLALAEWFGPADHLTVRSSKRGNTSYTIVLCEFGDNVMAHLEYMTGSERIEFEWSSHLHILEFDSLQMTGDASNNRTLYKNMEAIMAYAVLWDTSYDNKLEEIRELLQRGGKR